MNRTLSIWNDLRPYAVGFDNIFDHFSNTLEYTHSQNQSYPPYNINKIDNLNWQIEMALAGFNKKDINVTSENNMLTIESKQEDKSEDKDGEVLHKGISKRYFKKSFTISDDVEVKGAELKDGMLRVSMEKIIPESKKLKTIDIK